VLKDHLYGAKSLVRQGVSIEGDLKINR